MTTAKLQPGQAFPPLSFSTLGGDELTVGAPSNNSNWTLMVVYRGLHCPLCTRYLDELNAVNADLQALNIDLVAASADTQEKAAQQLNGINPTFTVGYDLSIAQMQTLGLYISEPRSAAETDRPFAEPGVFLIDEHGRLQVIGISNGPFVRPEIKTLIAGLQFIRNPDNNYPTRGTYRKQNRTPTENEKSLVPTI